jgi:hypothetical protein
MTNPTRIEVNCETKEVTEIELTDAEVAEMTYAAELAAEAKAEEEAQAAIKAEAREAILARLGLTAEEAAILLS